MNRRWTNFVARHPLFARFLLYFIAIDLFVGILFLPFKSERWSYAEAFTILLVVGVVTGGAAAIGSWLMSGTSNDNE